MLDPENHVTPNEDKAAAFIDKETGCTILCLADDSVSFYEDEKAIDTTSKDWDDPKDKKRKRILNFKLKMTVLDSQELMSRSHTKITMIHCQCQNHVKLTNFITKS